VTRVTTVAPAAVAIAADSGLPLAPDPPGRARIAVVRSGAKSVVSRAYASSPLRLLTPANHGHGAWLYTSSFGGGFVDGDHIVMDVDVGRGATAFISTQASTKIYRSPAGTSSATYARIAADGLLVAAPDPVVCFAGARYRQTQTFDLENGAALVLLDWVSSGRHAAGERWAFDEYRGRIIVRVKEQLLVHDALVLSAADGDLPARLGRFNVLAVVVVAGTTVARAASALVATVSATRVARRADQLVTATSLHDCGCVVRIAGTSVERVGRTIRELLGFVPALLGDDPWMRKW